MSIKRNWNNLINNIIPIDPCDECRFRGICNATVSCGMEGESYEEYLM